MAAPRSWTQLYSKKQMDVEALVTRGYERPISQFDLELADNLFKNHLTVVTSTHSRNGIGLYTTVPMLRDDVIMDVGTADLTAEDIVERCNPEVVKRRRLYEGPRQHIHHFIAAGACPDRLDSDFAKMCRWIDLTEIKSPALFINSNRKRANADFLHVNSNFVRVVATTDIEAYEEVFICYM